jgi:hypothetical protein
LAFSTESAATNQPRASGAPPWVNKQGNELALKGRYTQSRPYKAWRLEADRTQSGAALALGWFVTAPSVLNANAQFQTSRLEVMSCLRVEIVYVKTIRRRDVWRGNCLARRYNTLDAC